MEKRKGIRLLYSCLNMRRQLNKLLTRGELSLGEYLVLRNVKLSHSGLPAKFLQRSIKAADLSRILELSRPSITRILNSLEEREFITRSIDKEDRRSICIELTEKGLQVLEKANKGLLGIAERLVAELGEADTDKLIELVERLADIYETMLEEEGDEDE